LQAQKIQISQNRVKWCDAPNRDDVVYVDGVRCRVIQVVHEDGGESKVYVEWV